MARAGNKHTLDAPAKNRIGLVLTDEQVEMLDKCCYELRWTRTDVIRAGIEKIYQDVQNKKRD